MQIHVGSHEFPLQRNNFLIVFRPQSWAYMINQIIAQCSQLCDPCLELMDLFKEMLIF